MARTDQAEADDVANRDTARIRAYMAVAAALAAVLALGGLFLLITG
ncbi:MAG: hypothetical protein R2754_12640 [Microthrixaceae bacterium]